MEKLEELMNENIKLKEELIERIEENIKTLEEKDVLLDALIKRNKQTLELIGDMRIMVDGLSEISRGLELSSSRIAMETLKKIEERIEERVKNIET